MKIRFAFLLIGFMCLFNTGCKKTEPANTNTGNTNNSGSPLNQQFGSGITIPGDAAGAFFAVRSSVTQDSLTVTGGSAFAWFVSATNTTNVGSVFANADSLSIYVPNTTLTYPWYALISSNGGANLTGDSVTWAVGGSGHLEPLTHVDATPFPNVSFDLPATIDATTSLTVNFSITGSYDLIAFKLTGALGSVESSATSGSSVTFSSSQLSAVTIAGNQNVKLQIMPIKMASAVVNNRLYYFVKQTAITKNTHTL